MRMPSYLEEYDSYDSTYRPEDSFNTGNSRMSSRARSSRPRDVVRHTEYHSDAEEDFTKPYRPAAFAEKSKFIASIATSPFPVNAKIPKTVGRYNGMTDPSDHMQNFVAVGGVSGWTLPYWCHMFSLTLTGAASEWFEKLPDGKISSWDDLVKKLSQQFSQQKKHTRDQSEILDAIRRDNESIEDFITRFNEESLNIGGISRDMLRSAFCKNVKCDELIRTLTGRDGMPKEWDDHMTAAKLFANTEKTLGNNSSRQNSKLSFKLHDPINRQRGQSGQNFNQIQRHQNHLMQDLSSATRTRQDQQVEVLTDGLLFQKLPPRFLPLKIEIEATVKSGKLGHLVKDGKLGTGKAPMRDNQGPSKKQVKDLNVHMIQGGRKTEGKRRECDEEEWKNEPVIFPRVKGGPNTKNPLIITSLFGHYRFKYVLFDTGSTSDIMYEQCFEHLDKEDKERLKPIHAPVSGFGGEIMHPRGVTSFPVILSDGTHSRTEEVEFLVLPATSKHDIILGREAIGDFNAHPSTAHGAVEVPTPTGVAIIVTPP
ncbi:uncharacterized protein LOC143584262 [Bidens hawaiensis]|uniref:uncharacterized protein LOC143584262 n=1 Tax=Bidens hawaiensis TaxID=980011 RepID=UPI0040493D4F